MPYKCASCKQFFIGAPKFKLVGMSIDGNTLLCETCFVEDKDKDMAPRCQCQKNHSRCVRDASEGDAYCYACYDCTGECCCECDSCYQNDSWQAGKSTKKQKTVNFYMSKHKNLENRANFDYRDMRARTMAADGMIASCADDMRPMAADS